MTDTDAHRREFPRFKLATLIVSLNARGSDTKPFNALLTSTVSGIIHPNDLIDIKYTIVYLGGGEYRREALIIYRQNVA